MTLRVEEQQQQHRRKETAESGTRQPHHQAPGAKAPASQDALAQPTIIECRKKNSKQESVVTHRFRKGKLLGKGGFAHCYKVTCLETARPYAMKIVPKSTLVKSRARQKLQTEIKIHRTLQHPRVVRFEMFFEDRENVYILLELCTNHSLSELIRKTKRFTEDEARRYMLQILEATSYLHRHQIIHRDLKLGNVFLDRDWNIKMGDFGLATKLQQDSERKRTICGTPNYIAPEILEGKAGHSYQVDLWSAGVILYTMLVGRPPYESSDVKSTYRRILANVYAFPDSVPVSDSAKNLVGKLLQVKPELRPSLDEILNHPFLRNGGPRQRFSTSHGLRGSSVSSSPPSSAVPGDGGGCGGAASTGSRLGAQQKHGTPERGTSGGGLGRPPLKMKSSNVEAEGEVEADSAVARSVKPRARATAAAAAGKPSGDAGRDRDRDRDTLGGRHAAHAHGGSGAAKRLPSSSRSVVPRTGSTKGFSVYCDAKEPSTGRSRGRGGSAAGGGGGGGSGVPGASSSSSSGKRGSPLMSGGRRRDVGLAAAGGGGGGTVKSPGDKENDPRLVLGGGGGSGGGGVRVPVNGPISRRTIARSASSVGPSTTREASRGSRVQPEGSGGGGGSGSGSGAGTKGAAGARKASIRRSASAVGTQAEHRRATVRDGSEQPLRRKPAVGAGGRATGTTPATPRVRSSPYRGASGSPAVASSFSPYRSPMPGISSTAGGGSGGGRRVSARAVAVGDGATPRGQATGKGSAQQRLDFGGTPRPTRQRDSPLNPSGGGCGGGGGGKATRLAARLAATGASGARGAKSCPSPEATKDVQPGSAGRGRGEAEAAATTSGGGSKPKPADIERDALENMHDILTSGFATAAAGGGSSSFGRSGAARGTRASAAREAAVAAAAASASATEEVEVSAPAVWVTRYVDYSSKYGLGFLLSDGSAGVYFNDATKIVLEPAGAAFEYIERARKSSPGGGANSGDNPPRFRHTLDDFPPELQKKVTLLNHFRGYLHELVKKSEGGSAAAAGAAAAAVGADAAGESGGGRAASAGAGAHQSPGELTFLRKWMRTRNAILFRLSNRTVQVVFCDHTEVLLSEEARVVTFVKDGKRETHSLRRVLQDQRPDITKRLRYSNELIAQLLLRRA